MQLSNYINIPQTIRCNYAHRYLYCRYYTGNTCNTQLNIWVVIPVASGWLAAHNPYTNIVCE